MMIAGFSGLKNVGKDTAVAHLVKEHGFIRMAFGDAIYEEVAKAFNVDIELLKSREWKTTARPELALRNCSDEVFTRIVVARQMPRVGFNVSPICSELQTCPRNSTEILQLWGTEYRRMLISDSYWTDMIIHKLRELPYGSKVAFSDLRFDQEMAAFAVFVNMFENVKSGVAMITTPGATHTGHSSDSGLSHFYVDRTIRNTPGDIPGFLSQVDDFILRGMKWHKKK